MTTICSACGRPAPCALHPTADRYEFYDGQWCRRLDYGLAQYDGVMERLPARPTHRNAVTGEPAKFRRTPADVARERGWPEQGESLAWALHSTWPERPSWKSAPSRSGCGPTRTGS